VTERKLRMAIYLRVSSRSDEETPEDQKRQTTENQRYRLEEWLKHRTDVESVEWFRDEQTGRNAERPGLKALLDGVNSGRFNMVVALRIDRLFRSMKDLAEITSIFHDKKVGMILIDSGIDIDPEWNNPTSELLLHILGAIAQFEDVLISSRTKDGLARLLKENEVREKNGLPRKRIGRPPYGFRANPDPTKSGEFIQVPEEMETARKVVRLKQRGAGYGEISERLHLNRETVRNIIKHKELYF